MHVALTSYIECIFVCMHVRSLTDAACLVVSLVQCVAVDTGTLKTAVCVNTRLFAMRRSLSTLVDI